MNNNQDPFKQESILVSIFGFATAMALIFGAYLLICTL